MHKVVDYVPTVAQKSGFAGTPKPIVQNVAYPFPEPHKQSSLSQSR